MTEYPRMLYKAGGPHEIHGAHFDTLIVVDDDELDVALAGGWALTTPEAAKAATTPLPVPDLDDDEPPTRDELKQKAAELGLTYAHNISNIKLAELIEAALAQD